MVRALAVVLLALVLPFAAVAGAGESPRYVVSVDGLACPFCAYGIEKQLRKIDGVTAVEVDIAKGQVRVTMASGRTLTEDQARAATEKAGFTLRAFEAVQSP